jgi:lipopolysaccharide biosynthesis glycosyltransferase
MKVAFTTTLDDRYLSGFLITFNSILRNSKNFNHDLVIFEWGNLSDDSKTIIKQFYDKVTFKSVETDLYENHQYDETFRKWTYNCNYRFDIFTLEEYDRVVFFDCDMVFEIDTDELLAYDVDFGASGVEIGRITQIGNRAGFDAGVMTISKKYLGKHIREELLKIAATEAPKEIFLNSTKWTSDEPIINTFFLDKVTFLPEKFNLVISEVKNSDFNQKNNYQYTGHNKPWYSDKKERQYSPYALEKIAQTNQPYMQTVILTKLNNIVKKEIDDLAEKNIDIYKYVGEFYE